MQPLATDFADMIELLNKHLVDYMVVGGYAVAAHGRPRFTEDFDIWIKVEKENSLKIWEALKEFGYGNVKGLSAKDFENETMVTQLGFPPLRIDILGSISGVGFDEAYKESIIRKVGNLEMRFIGLKALIDNKIASGRPKDLLDVKDLKVIQLKLTKRKI